MIIKDCRMRVAIYIQDILGVQIVDLDESTDAYDMIAPNERLYDVSIENSRGFNIIKGAENESTFLTLKIVDLAGEWISIKLDNRDYTKIVIM